MTRFSLLSRVRCARTRLSSLARRRPLLFLELLETRWVPAVFNVNTLADTDAVNLTTGVDANGNISLRSALEAANNLGGGNTINLTIAGQYLATTGHTGPNNDQSPLGAFTILPSSGGVSISNTSSGTVSVVGTGEDRVFDINPQDLTSSTSIKVSMAGFTIQNGAAQPGDGPDGSGGGIRDQGPIGLTLTNMRIANNTASADGGGISMENTISTPWTLTLNNSSVTYNRAGDAGGGVETDGSGHVVMSGDLIQGNVAVNQGAGIWLDGITYPNITTPATSGVLSAPVTSGGSGYTSAPDVTISAPASGTTATATATVVDGMVTGITITNPGSGYTAAPTVTFSGTGTGATANANLLIQSATMTMTNSLVSNNTSLTAGQFGGGIGTAGDGNITITNSTIANNVAAGNGGGFADEGGQSSITLVNTTFYNNSAGLYGGGFYAFGNSTVTIDDSTIYKNSAQAIGGGVFIPDTPAANITINNTIVAENVSGPMNFVSGSVTSLIVTNGGSGYTTAPPVTITNASGDTTGSGATATAVLTGDTITGLTITNPGTGYTLPPIVTIDAPTTGTTATASASIASPAPDILANATGTGNLIGIGDSNLVGIGNGTIGTAINYVGTPTIPVALPAGSGPLNPQLGTLQNNGGPTPTVLPLSDSTLVINKGVVSAVPAVDPITGLPLTDQRGFLRVVGSGVDIGAVEFQPGATSVSLTGSSTIGLLAQPFTLTAHVAFTSLAPNNEPTGSVTFFDGAVQLGSATVSAEGSATFTTSTLPKGNLSLTATFTPDAAGLSAGEESSTSAGLSVTINPADTVGTFDPTTATFSLSSTNGSGAATAGQFVYGAPGWIGLVGDFTGDGQTTVVVVDPTTETWYIRNDNSEGPPSFTPFQYGAPGWIPVVGDWNGSGKDGIGVVNPHTGTWYLRNEVSAGTPDAGEFQYGLAGWTPVVGNWAGNADGMDGIGMVDTTTETWYLRDTPTEGAVSITPFQYGAPSWKPLAGDWTGTGSTGIGVFDPSGTFYLRSEATAGTPDAGKFQFGTGTSTPLAGEWFNPSNPSQLLLAAGVGPGAASINNATLQSTVQEALGLLTSDGVNPALVQQLASANYMVGQLPPGVLGETFVAANTVLISADAAGFGWYTDTSADDPAFGADGAAAPGSSAAGEEDLLTTVLHEMGHLAGQADVNNVPTGPTLMDAILPLGVRRIEALDQVFASGSFV